MKVGLPRVSIGRRHVAGLMPIAATLAGVLVTPSAAQAQRIENNTAVFAALDKVTARIRRLEAPLGKTEEFGALRITARACYSRPPTETPKTSTFVEIDEVLRDGKVQRIFTGWMFAESPGLNALQHPVFDLWLTECASPSRTAATQRGGSASDQPEEGEPEPPAARRRVRR
ncbi:MAG: DUF2155 domain-containing protein [Hyphomicrobiaceae bacterium]